MTIKLADRTGQWLQHACMLAKVNNHEEITPNHFYCAVLEDHEFFTDLWNEHPELEAELKAYQQYQFMSIKSADYEATPELSDEMKEIYSVLAAHRAPSKMPVPPEAFFKEMIVHHPIMVGVGGSLVAIYALKKLKELVKDREDINNIKQELNAEVLMNFQPNPPAPAKPEPATIAGTLSTHIPFLRDDLAESIFGQDHALDAVSDTLIVSAAGFERENKTAGSFLFTGPSGVGKTELARELATNLGIPLLKFDMSEYMEPHSVAKLIGSPPGYVSSTDGGRLVNQVRANPCAVVLFDEIEKAHPQVFNLLLQIMDDGKLTDGKGQEAHFGNIIFIATSNTGASAAKKEVLGFGTGSSSQKERYDEAVKEKFLPELRNRFDDIIQFNDIKAEIMPQIVDKFTSRFAEELEQKSIRATFTQAARGCLIEKGIQSEFGPRDVKRILERDVKSKVAAHFLAGVISGGSEVVVDYDADRRKLTTTFHEKPAALAMAA